GEARQDIRRRLRPADGGRSAAGARLRRSLRVRPEGSAGECETLSLVVGTRGEDDEALVAAVLARGRLARPRARRCGRSSGRRAADAGTAAVLADRGGALPGGPRPGATPRHPGRPQPV